MTARSDAALQPPSHQQLARAFLDAAAPDRGPLPALDDASEALGLALLEALGRAQQTWPGLKVSPLVFVRTLAERAEPDLDPLVFLSRVQAPDLYLVCGCLEGDVQALRLLEEHFIARLAREQRRGGLTVYVDEAQQQLRVRLLVAHGDQPPRLAGYRGRGPLLAWLRLTLTRLALNLREAGVRDVPLDRELLSSAPANLDPELEFLRRQHKEAIASAMTEAFEAVTDEERTILRMHFLDGLSADQVGSLFEVSGRTIQRRIEDARRTILKRTRTLLREQFRLNASQLDTIMRLAQSDLDLSLSRILGQNPGQKGPR